MTGRSPLQSLSIVVPAYNEERRLGVTLGELAAFAQRHVADHEILVVDDCSTDGTAAIARAAPDHRVRLLQHERNRGKGRALRTGAEQARGDWVLFVDADHAIPIDHLLAFAPHTATSPIVIGSKRAAGSEVEYRRWRWWLGTAGQWLVRALAGCGVRDTQCGFKLVRTDVARRLLALQTIERFGFDFELLYLARRYGMPIVELPVRCSDAGDGSVRLGSYVRTLTELGHLVRNRLTARYPSELPP